MTRLGNQQRMAPVCVFVLVLGFCTAVDAVEFTGGTGEPNDPYQIATAEQLIALGKDPNLYDRHFVLVADIDWPQSPPVGRVVTKEAVAVIAPGSVASDGSGGFTGRFNGDHYAIRNLQIHGVKASYLGLFGCIGPGGRVENLRLENADIIGDSTLGLLAASNGGTIANCTVTGFIQGERGVGGLVGENGLRGNSRAPGPLWPPGQIEHCGSACTVKGSDSVGGLVGINLRGAITYSWADCTIDGGDNIGGLVGTTYLDEISSCYAFGHITGLGDVGGLIGTNMDAMVRACYAQAEVSGVGAAAGLIADNEGGTVYCCYSAGRVFSKKQAAGLISIHRSGTVHLCYWDLETAGTGYSARGEGRTTSQMQSAATFDGWGFLGQWSLDHLHDYPRLAWQGFPGHLLRDAEHSYSGGTGEPNAPYQVATAEDLAAIGRYAGDWGKHFVMVRDIDLTDAGVNGLTPIGFSGIPFTGVFDGNDCVISNTRFDLPDEDYVSLFRYVGQANTEVNTPGGVIRHLHLDQVDIVGGDWVAGLAGFNRGLIESCSVRGSLASPRGVAGLVAQNFGQITGCQADVHVVRSDPRFRGPGDAGGLVVHNEGTIRGSSAAGSVDGASGASGTGGLVATSQGGEIENSWASAEVHGFWSAGGLVGSASGTKITGCYACGPVHSDRDIGEEPVGGLVGSMYGTLRSSYATGSVSGNGYVGALVGQNGGTIASCYATGEVAGSGTRGGLVADDFFGAVYLSYWDCQTTGIDTSEGGDPKSTEQMMRAATFRGWGVGGYWKIDEGWDYPRLFWEDMPGTPILDGPRSYGGGTGTADDPYRIESPGQLAMIGWYRDDFDKCFVLTADIDMAGTDANTILPIGTAGIPFTGVFDGNDHSISNYTRIRPRDNYVGLFGVIGGKTPSHDARQVKRLSVASACVSGLYSVGILAAVNSGVIVDCHVAGVVEGHWDVGGLAGRNDGGTISRSSSSSDISGDMRVGGLVGYNQYAHVYDSCCRGSLSGARDVGGLAGTNMWGTLSNCYSTCSVFSTSSSAGLVADNRYEGTVEHCYFGGRLEATESVAGLVLTNATNPGMETVRQGTVRSCFWDIESSEAIDGVLDQDPDPDGAYGRTTVQMHMAATFVAAGWDFADVWTICEGKDYPRLWWEQVTCE
jgi:hypothetical protein